MSLSDTRETLTTDGQRRLKRPRKATQRLSTTYILKEAFETLWSYERDGY